MNINVFRPLKKGENILDLDLTTNVAENTDTLLIRNICPQK
jgi:hypothetical protein